MSGPSNIEWTEHTWNPIVGCSILTPGCTNCYAMKMAGRIEAMKRSHYDGTTKPSKAGTVWTGKLALAPDNILLEPLRRKKPTTYFVNSMGDLFHEDAPDEWIDKVLLVMREAKQHTFQILTKRADRMRAYLDQFEVRGRYVCSDTRSQVGHDPRDGCRLMLLDDDQKWPLPNVWLGVSTERQQEADERIPLLLQTPAAVRFISAEPLLGPIDLQNLALPKDWERCTCTEHEPHLNALTASVYCEGCCEGPEALSLGRLDWVIAGGESGVNARPMSIQWVQELREQCADTEVSFFFKQWGEWAPAGPHPSEAPGRFAFGDYEHDRSAMVQVDHYPRQFTKFGARSVVERVGKKAAGRLLDGIEHNAMPMKG